jgi:hypothetical protein
MLKSRLGNLASEGLSDEFALVETLLETSEIG